VAQQQPKLPIIGVHRWINKRLQITILCAILKLLHLTHGSHLIAERGRVTRENKPRVHEVITDLQAFVSHS
jgi:hypothetical protein